MRIYAIAVMLALLGGCDMGPSPEAVRKQEADAEARKLAAGKKQYAAFLAEADKGLQLLEKHPNRDALRDQVNRLHEMLTAADDAAPGNDKMGDLIDEGRGLLRYFDACVKVANFQANRKDVSPEKAQSFLDKTCDANAGPIRELIAQLRKKNES